MLPERQFMSIRPPGWVNLYGLWMKCQTAYPERSEGPFVPKDPSQMLGMTGAARHSAAARVGVVSARAVRMVTNSSPAVG